MKRVARFIDRTLGPPLRALILLAAHIFILCNYRVERKGLDELRRCTKGGIIVSNHTSFFDAVFLACELWQFGWISGVVWHEEYFRWYYRPVFKLFGAVPAGSSKRLPDSERERRTANLLTSIKKILTAGKFVVICPEGGVGNGGPVVIPSRYISVCESIRAHPELPVLMVTLDGLQYSAFGRRRLGYWYPRLPIRIALERVDNVSLVGGSAGLNRRLEQYYNEGIPLARAGHEPSHWLGV